jgi:calpain-15
MWLPLLEKAYAKSYGSFLSLHGGLIREALLDLSGCPCECVSFSPSSSNPPFDSELFWQRLVSFSSCGFPMGASTSTSHCGIVGGHAYSILDCKELADVMLGEQKKLTEYFVTDSRAIVETDRLEALRREQTLLSEDGTLRVIRLRNPWGRREWQVL